MVNLEAKKSFLYKFNQGDDSWPQIEVRLHHLQILYVYIMISKYICIQTVYVNMYIYIYKAIWHAQVFPQEASDVIHEAITMGLEAAYSNRGAFWTSKRCYYTNLHH